MSIEINPDDALIVVDPQNDFFPGGALPVAEGNRIIDPLNSVLPRFRRVYATRDWHPKNHSSFQAEGGPWPYHCVQGSEGAKFNPELKTDEIDSVVSTGYERDLAGYSGFEGTDLEQLLRADGITRVFIGGLATDYCVKATALDAKKNGFEVVVLTDAIAAVKVKPEDERQALEAMQLAGCMLATTTDLAAAVAR